MHTGIDLDPRMHTVVMEPTAPIIVVHSADHRRSWRRWQSSSNAAAVDVGGSDGGLRP